MWCANCRSEVAAEVQPDSRRAHCANCGSEIATTSARTLSRTQQARELLARWSEDRGKDPFETAPAAASAPVTEAPQTRTTVSETYPVVQPDETQTPNASKPHFRIDAAHAPGGPNTPTAAPQPPNPAPVPGGHRVDAAHSTPAPHVPISVQQPKRPMKWVAVAGQCLAYIGVLGLMAGTCMVILGYFRGPETYAPTGWLITMAGQMLLFLGVVTLVSSGMEETTNTVADRIDRLNDKLLRIEEATDALRGSHFNAANADEATKHVTRQAS